MNSKGNRVILILVVGLASFTSAMRELNQLRQFGMEANHFIAQWTEKLTPAEVPAQVVARVETCESKQSEPAVELPWLDNSVAQEDEIADIEEPEAAPPPAVKPHKAAKVKKARRADVDPKEFEVRIFNDEDTPAVFEFQQPPFASSFKFKSRKHGSSFRITPRDREMLKSLNRSINLRIAS
jgi:hypothetical protein